ncbi:MAG: glycosyltransferase family 2 protein, partial [Bacteroidetes bacterium]
MTNKKYPYQLSIIIVNYNVSYFIDQCLDSVKKACADLTHEIIVVDNASKDDSVSVIRNNYPDVKLIANSENYGFSKANNQGIEVASGEWILLLNPDTVLGEKTLFSALEFVKDKPDCGALGIRMINGKGEFLPESKRGLPTPAVAFYKLSGLSKIFPRSKRFNQYHAGNIAESENAEIDIL